jgi:hypothetical protein
MVEIYAQIHVKKEAKANGVLEEHLKMDKQKKGAKVKGKIPVIANNNKKHEDNRITDEEKKKVAEEIEKFEHPKEWHLMSDFEGEIKIKNF